MTQTAMEQAEALLDAMADAGRRADAAMKAARTSYRHGSGFAQRNLQEMWFWYAALTRMHPRPRELCGARRQLRIAIGVYRRLNLEEARGIDTSVPGWRGGRAV